MTFKDIQKKLVQKQEYSQSPDSKYTRLLFDRLRAKPFWIWDISRHRQEDTRTNGDCCFNHIIGLPKKNNEEKPFYDYEKTIFDYLENSNREQSKKNNNDRTGKHLWIKKATGLGITEFMLSYVAWLCIKDDKLKGTQMCIVTGARIDLAIELLESLLSRRWCTHP